MDHPNLTGSAAFCPLCNDEHPHLRIPYAAKVLEVDRRTIYRYIEDGRIHVFKPGRIGHPRVCSGCLFGDEAKTKHQSFRPKIKNKL